MFKAYRFKLTSSIDVYCRSSVAGTMDYNVEYPFAWISVSGISDCSSSPNTTTTEIWTGYGPTVWLFTSLVGVSMVYASAAILFYIKNHELYDAQKRFPAFDLLISLILASLWALDSYLAWTNFPALKEEVNPDHVINKVKVCNDSGGYCTSAVAAEFGEMNSYLFLALACAVSWAIAVWFIFMESGLCPDDDEDLDYADLEPDAGVGVAMANARLNGMNSTFFPFPDHMVNEKDRVARMDHYDAIWNNGNNHLQDKALMQQQFMEYLSNWKNHSNNSMNSGSKLFNNNEGEQEDRFANGYTFAPIRDPVSSVSMISRNELQRDIVGNKVHSKWNLFKA